MRLWKMLLIVTVIGLAIFGCASPTAPTKVEPKVVTDTTIVGRDSVKTCVIGPVVGGLSACRG